VGPWARPDDVFDPADADAIVLWRQCFGGIVEYLIGEVEYLARLRVVEIVGLPPSGYGGYHAIYPAIAPIVAWARTREEWSK
jgi:hypothetical protein